MTYCSAEIVAVCTHLDLSLGRGDLTIISDIFVTVGTMYIRTIRCTISRTTRCTTRTFQLLGIVYNITIDSIHIKVSIGVGIVVDQVVFEVRIIVQLFCVGSFGLYLK